MSSYFEHFAAAEILKNYNLSDDEIDAGNTGGGNDGGCDGLYLFLNDELISPDQIETLTAVRGSVVVFYIIQVKNELKFGEETIMKWKTTSENLLQMSCFEKDYINRYNEKTLEGFALFRDTVKKLVRSQIKLKIHYYYVTLGTEVHPNVRQQADE